MKLYTATFCSYRNSEEAFVYILYIVEIDCLDTNNENKT